MLCCSCEQHTIFSFARSHTLSGDFEVKQELSSRLVSGWFQVGCEQRKCPHAFMTWIISAENNQTANYRCSPFSSFHNVSLSGYLRIRTMFPDFPFYTRHYEESQQWQKITLFSSFNFMHTLLPLSKVFQINWSQDKICALK